MNGEDNQSEKSLVLGSVTCGSKLWQQQKKWRARAIGTFDQHEATPKKSRFPGDGGLILVRAGNFFIFRFSCTVVCMGIDPIR